MPKLTKRQLVATVIIGFMLSLICGADTTRPFFYYVGVFVGSCVLLAGLFLPTRYLIYPLFVLIINMLDLTQAAEDQLAFGDVYTASPWQFRLGPFPPAVIVFASLIVVAVRLFKVKRENSFTLFFIYFFVIVTMVSIWFGYPQEDLGRFVADAKVPLFFGIGLIIFSGYYERYPESIQITNQIFLGLLVGHFALDLVYLLLGVSTSMVSGFKNVSLDSGKGMLALMIFWGLGNLMNRRQIPLSLGVALVSFYLLLSYQTRWLIVSVALGLLVMVPILMGTKRVLKIYIPIIILAFISVPILNQARPEAWEVMRLRFSFIEKLGPGASLEDADQARGASIYNAMGLLLEEKAVLTGMGYGSWWDGRFYPMPALTVSAFDAQSLNSGRYYRVHDFTFHFLFKFGLIGLFVYLGTFLKPVRQMWKMRRTLLEDPQQRAVATMVFASVPLIATNMWFTGKGLLVSGLFIAVSHAWVRSFKKQMAGESAVVVKPKLPIRRGRITLPVRVRDLSVPGNPGKILPQ